MTLGIYLYFDLICTKIRWFVTFIRKQTVNNVQLALSHMAINITHLYLSYKWVPYILVTSLWLWNPSIDVQMTRIYVRTLFCVRRSLLFKTSHDKISGFSWHNASMYDGNMCVTLSGHIKNRILPFVSLAKHTIPSLRRLWWPVKHTARSTMRLSTVAWS